MKLLLSIAPTLLAALVYLNSLHGLLVFDDEPAIVRNMDVRPELVPFGDLWRHDFWGTPIAFSTSNKSYRPLTVASFRWNVGLHGVEYVEGFHGVNVVLHALATALFHLLCLRLLRLERLPGAGFRARPYVDFATAPRRVRSARGRTLRARVA